MNWFIDLMTGSSVAHAILVYSFVIAIGVILGKVKFFGISLGATFVLFVGIAAGHFGWAVDPSILKFIQEFGLILFIFSIGLQVGPSFFSSFKEGGLVLNGLAILIIALNIVVALSIYYIVGDVKITDMVGILRAHGAAMAAVDCPDAVELMGVNSRIQLAQASRAMQERINLTHMAAGVTMLDPTQVWIGPDVTIGRDTEILPGTMLWGDTHIGENCLVGPQTRLTDTRVGSGCVVDETVAVQAVIDNDVECGPRAYLRPGAHLCDGSKAGTHVEIKKSTVGKGSKVPHLSYIGDCTIGEGVNIGAGTITCNYDGKNKNATTIGDGTFIGSDTMLVAPVNIGSRCTVGAGSTITRDVPDGALAVERSEQTVKPGWRPKWDRA